METESKMKTVLQKYLLRQSNRNIAEKEYLNALVGKLRSMSGHEFVGIRILNKEGYLPYASQQGFGRDFCSLENWISIKNDRCICVRVAIGRPEEEDAPFVTPWGSFYSPDLKKFMAGLSPIQLEKYRGICAKGGFESIAIIPIRYRQKITGVIHLADRKKDGISKSVISSIESVTPLIGEALRRYAVERELHEDYDIQNVVNLLLKLSLKNISLEEILDYSLKMILSLPWLAFGSTGSFFLSEGNPPRLVMKASLGISAELKKKCARISFGKCMCGRAAASQEIQFSSSVDERHDISHERDYPHGHYCVPIVLRHRTLGVINIYIKEGHIPTHKEKEFLATVANVLAGIIQGRRDQEEIKRVNRALTMLSECNRTLIHAKDEAGLLEDICRIIVHTGGYSWASVGCAIEDRKEAVQSQVSVRPESRKGYKSSVSLPLRGEAKIIGTLNIYSEDADSFDEKEVKLLTELADDLAFGIVTLRIRKARTQAEQELIETYNHMGINNRKISVLLDLDRHDDKGDKKGITNFVLNSAVNMSSALFGALYRIDEEQNFHLLSSVGATKRQEKEIRMLSAASSDFLKAFVKKKKRLRGIFASHNLACFKVNNHLECLWALPLAQDGRALGALFLGLNDKKGITSQELEFYDVFTSHAAAALSNAGILK